MNSIPEPRTRDRPEAGDAQSFRIQSAQTPTHIVLASGDTLSAAFDPFTMFDLPRPNRAARRRCP